MSGLIERIEAAAGPDRELDAQIAAYARAGLPDGCDWAFKFPKWEAAPNKTGTVRIIGNWSGNGDHIAGNFCSPAYTASIDTAMTLVPEGCEWRLDSHYNMAGVFAYPVDPESGPYCVEYAGESSTPALALCVAALRALRSDRLEALMETADA